MSNTQYSTTKQSKLKTINLLANNVHAWLNDNNISDHNMKSSTKNSLKNVFKDEIKKYCFVQQCKRYHFFHKNNLYIKINKSAIYKQYFFVTWDMLGLRTIVGLLKCLTRTTKMNWVFSPKFSNRLQNWPNWVKCSRT